MITPPFMLLDETRRQAGRMLDALGLGSIESPFRIAAPWPGARLRAYHPHEFAPAPVLVVISAPIKRACVWDLLPEVGAVRHCLRRGLRVLWPRVLDWVRARWGA